MSGEDVVVRVAAAVIRRADRVLVQTRTAGRHYEGHWEFPGGKCEPDESAETCCVRECAEELDLDVDVVAPFGEMRWRYPQRDVHVTFLLCRPRGAREPVACEGQTLRWADAADLGRLAFLPANAEVLARLVPLLRDAAH